MTARRALNWEKPRATELRRCDTTPRKSELQRSWEYAHYLAFAADGAAMVRERERGEYKQGQRLVQSKSPQIPEATGRVRFYRAVILARRDSITHYYHSPSSFPISLLHVPSQSKNQVSYCYGPLAQEGGSDGGGRGTSHQGRSHCIGR